MSHATQLTTPTAREIEKAWELFVTGTENEGFLEKVRPEIRESWLRSRQAGVSPATQRLPTVLSPEELDSRCHQNAYLLEAGRDVIAFLSKVLTADAFITTIVDSERNLLYSYAPSHRHDKQEAVNALPGAGLQEYLVGTNAAAMALYLNRSALMSGYEMYSEFMHNWVACSAPIHSSDGDACGALTVSGYREVAHHNMFDLVVSAVSSIEKRIKYFEELAHLEVLKEFNRCLLKFPESPVLAFSLHGHIIALSPAVAKLATSLPPERLIGQRLYDVQDFHFAEGLFPPPANESSTPYESSIVLPHHGKTGSATIIPISSKEGPRAGFVVIVSGLAQPAAKKIAKPLWHARHTFHELIGHAPAFSRAVELAHKAAEYDQPVLLIGESGTGKELFAQAIHRASCHALGPFVAVNCATIPKDLASAELFGYEEGAFSGAKRGGQQGKVELAHRGTLFLDEVGDMPADIQVSFLRVLEEREVVPLGSKHPRPVNVRVIAALNENPATAVAQGKLRLDLCHRLNVFPIPLPPLRERLEDLPVLVRHLLDLEGFADVDVAPEVMEVFRHNAWPGNIRELRNVLVRAAILDPNQLITREQLALELLTPKPSAQGNPQQDAANPPIPPLQKGEITTGGNPAFRTAAQRIDRAQILRAIEECRGNVAQAAQCLGIHRVTLYRKLRQKDTNRQGDLSQRLKKLTARHYQNENQEPESSDLISLVVRAVFQCTGASISSVSSISSISNVTGEVLQAGDTKRWSLKTVEIAYAAQCLTREEKELNIDPAWVTSKRVGRVLARLRLQKDPDTSTRAWQVGPGELARLAVALGSTP